MKISFLLLLVLLIPHLASAETLTLAEAVARSGRVNPSLKVQAFSERLAHDATRISYGAYLPRIDIQGGYTAQLEPQAISTGTAMFATQQADYGFFSLAVNQTLYDFGRTDARYGRAKIAEEAARLGYRGQEQGVFLQVVAAYFRILQTGKLLQAADEEVRQMTDHLRVAQNLFEQGVVTRNDLLQAEVRLASSKQRRLEVANRRENAWLNLNHLTGQDPGYRADLPEDAKLDATDLELAPEEATSGRSELVAQRRLVEGSQLEVTEVKSAFYPEFYLRMGMDYLQNKQVREQTIMAATVGLKMNVFEGFATTARYRQALSNRSRAAELLRQMEAEAALEYRTAVNDAKVAAERLTVTAQSIRQGEENLRINKDRYIEQVGTATAVIDAQTLLSEIKSENFQALFDYQVAVARVQRARGQL